MKQSIVFAHFKNGEFLGYRQDTFGTLGKDWAKIYTYSQDQVNTVLKNIASSLEYNRSSVGKALAIAGADPSSCNMISRAEQKIYEQGQKARAFEVRVVKAPDKVFEREFNVKTAEYETSVFPSYPENFQEWCKNYEDHETIETHYFSLDGQLNLQ